MPDYTLQLLIDDQDLITLKAAQLNIILAKPVGSASSMPNVIWQSFDPFIDNTVSWTENYGIYASNTVVQNGAAITKLSSVNPAQDGSYYSFASSATFNGPFRDQGAPDTGTYQVNNDMPAAQYPSLVFGLLQSATINNVVTPSRPLNAQVVPAAFFADFTPLTTVYAWLQASILSETVITQVTSRSTKVTFGGSVNSQVLKYDRKAGMFLPYIPETNSFTEVPHVRLLNPAAL